MKNLKLVFKHIGLFFKKIWKKIVEKTEESPKTVGALITAFNGLFQLAISQIHIFALIRIKPTNANTTGIPSTGIGMFFFAFILFGLVSIFTATRINSAKSSLIAAFSNLFTIVFGLYFLLQITNPSTYISFNHVIESIIYMIIGLLLYIVAIVFYIIQVPKYKGREVIIDED